MIRCCEKNREMEKKEKKQQQRTNKVDIVNRYLDEAKKALEPPKKNKKRHRARFEAIHVEESNKNYSVRQLGDAVQKLTLKDDIQNKPKIVRRLRDKFGEQPQFGEFTEVSPLPFYFPGEKIKLAQTKKFSMASLVKGDPLMKTYVDSLNLQPENINLALRMILQIEDLHTMLPYCSLYQNRARVEHHNDRLKFKVNVPKKININDILSPETDQVVFVPLQSTSLQENKLKYEVDILRVNAHEDKNTHSDLRRHVRTLKEMKGNIANVKVNENNDEDDHERGKNKNNPPFDIEKSYDIILRPNRYSFRVQHRALDLLDNEKRNYVFPVGELPKVESTTDINLKIINRQICENAEQLQAVKQIVGGANPYTPYIVVGPPGTGKTTTIVEAILQLYIQNKDHHILVTTGSNSACDTVALKICEHFEINPRLKELSRQRRGKNGNGKPGPSYDILRVFSNSWIKKNGFKNISPLMVDYGNFINGKFISPAVSALQKFNIIVVTLCTMGRLRTGIVGNWPFTHVFIDEASAITETEALIGITSVNTKKCRIIMSGDTKQLGPVVMSRIAAELGLKHSLMERLLERDCYAVKVDGSYDRTLQMRLRQNYRSHPEILRLFNHLYYDDELIAKVKMESLLKFDKLSINTNKNFPIIFHAVNGNLGASENSKSSYNQAEIDKVVWIIYQLKKSTDLRNIGIVSPYRLQCSKIKEELSRRKLNGIEVGTAEIYQGREKPVMIASFVKSFCHLGFVTDPQRLNVMLSRAQSLLILVGNPRTLKHNNDFNYLIEECKSMGTFRSS